MADMPRNGAAQAQEALVGGAALDFFEHRLGKRRSGLDDQADALKVGWPATPAQKGRVGGAGLTLEGFNRFE